MELLISMNWPRFSKRYLTLTWETFTEPSLRFDYVKKTGPSLLIILEIVCMAEWCDADQKEPT